MQVILQAAKCTQMSNPDGTGSGGDRCTYACFGIFDVSGKVGPEAQAGVDARTIMFERVKQDWPALYPNAQPMNGSWVGTALNALSNGRVYMTNVHSPSFQDIVSMIDRGHIGMGGFNDYNKLKLADGSSPYSWHDPDNLGHVLVVVGYDDDFNRAGEQVVFVHDPLLSTQRQPSAYSFASFQTAVFSDLSELQGVNMSGVTLGGVPQGWTDDGTTLRAPNGQTVSGAFRAFIIVNGWDSSDIPEAAQEHVSSLEDANPSLGPGTRQVFRLSVLEWEDAQVQTKGVIKMWIGPEYLALIKEKSDLTLQVSDLQNQIALLQKFPLSEVHQALVAASNLTGPFASADALVKKALSDLG